MAVSWRLLIAVLALCAQASAFERPAPFSSFHILTSRAVSHRRTSRSAPAAAGSLRINNGNDADPGQFPHQVGMYVDMSLFCGGALIHPKWILTAASCAKSDSGSRYTAYLGASNIYLPAEKGRVAVTTTQAYIHDDFDKATYKNDVALILLPRAVKTSDRIKPIALPPSSYASKDFTGISLKLSGWGLLGDNAAYISPKLQYAILQGLDKNTCVKTYSFEIVSDDILCCSGSSKQNACQGDTGGALVEVATDGSFTHVGIASFMPSRGCSLGKPSGFTKTANFLNWISSQTGITITP